jgi:hypothetical protein
MNSPDKAELDGFGLLALGIVNPVLALAATIEIGLDKKSDCVQS